jgi:hypothetical protein
LLEQYPDRGRYCDIRFNVESTAQVQTFGSGEKRREETIAYLYATPLSRGGRLLAAYGHGGYETLCWSEFLANHPDLVLDTLDTVNSASTRLVIGEFIPPRDIPHPLFQSELNVVVDEPGYRPRGGEVLITRVVIE